RAPQRIRTRAMQRTTKRLLSAKSTTRRIMASPLRKLSQAHRFCVKGFALPWQAKPGARTRSGCGLRVPERAAAGQQNNRARDEIWTLGAEFPRGSAAKVRTQTANESESAVRRPGSANRGIEARKARRRGASSWG